MYRWGRAVLRAPTERGPSLHQFSISGPRHAACWRSGSSEGSGQLEMAQLCQRKTEPRHDDDSRQGVDASRRNTNELLGWVLSVITSIRKRRIAGERGGVLVIVALGMFAIVFIVALVVDAANWFEHQRHLQLQADAAALAGADAMSLPLSACNDTTISTAAHNYGGTDATHIAQYNDQVAAKYDAGGFAPNLHILVNS